MKKLISEVRQLIWDIFSDTGNRLKMEHTRRMLDWLMEHDKVMGEGDGKIIEDSKGKSKKPKAG